jgi:hypothetical protein
MKKGNEQPLHAPKKTRTHTLKKYITDQGIRLGANDREFLRDLARVQVIDVKDAEHHYLFNKGGGEKRLDKLCKAGILESKNIYNPNSGLIKSYLFKTDKIATLFKGKKPKLNLRRSGLHDLIASKIYFAEGRPKTFVLESNFNEEQKKLFQFGQGMVAGRNVCYPDAFFVSNGDVVLVESDSGQYTQTQINAKQAAWHGKKQVWGRPTGTRTRVKKAMVHNF